MRRVKDDMLRAMSDREDDTAVYLYMIDAVYSVTSTDAEGWFIHSGYLLIHVLLMHLNIIACPFS